MDARNADPPQKVLQAFDQKGSASQATWPFSRGADLFPIRTSNLAAALPQANSDVVQATKGVLDVLNFLYLGGAPAPCQTQHSRAQRAAIERICCAVARLDARDLTCPTWEVLQESLGAAKFVYAGGPVHPMEELQAAKVIPAWPSPGEAAVQEAVNFVGDSMKEKLLNPHMTLRPRAEWPARPPKSRVRASDEEWEAICKAAAARGLMRGVREDELFKDHRGVPVLNGAGAVKKVKSTPEGPKQVQRFISNLIPSNAYMEHIEGDDKFLPYLGQLTLLSLGPEEELVIDSEDFTSCFNLFRLRECWAGFLAFDKQVDAAIFGDAGGACVARHGSDPYGVVERCSGDPNHRPHFSFPRGRSGRRD